MNTKKRAPDQKDDSLPLSDDPIFGLIKKNKNVLFVGLLLVVIVVVVVKLYAGHTEGKEEKSWSDFYEASKETNAVAALGGILEESSGSSAEPWILYYLSVRAFGEHDLVTAKEKLELLESNHSDHFLLNNPEWVPSIKRKVLAEIEWCEQNPLPEEAPAVDEPEADADSTPPDAANSDG